MAEQVVAPPAPRGREALARALERSRRSGATLGVASASPQLVEALSAWRLSEARRRRVPAFRILTDAVLGAIATARPRDGASLQRIHGVGPKLAERYGETILALVGRDVLLRPTAAPPASPRGGWRRRFFMRK